MSDRWHGRKAWTMAVVTAAALVAVCGGNTLERRGGFTPVAQAQDVSSTGPVDADQALEEFRRSLEAEFGPEEAEKIINPSSAEEPPPAEGGAEEAAPPAPTYGVGASFVPEDNDLFGDGSEILGEEDLLDMPATASAVSTVDVPQGGTEAGSQTAAGEPETTAEAPPLEPMAEGEFAPETTDVLAEPALGDELFPEVDAGMDTEPMEKATAADVSPEPAPAAGSEPFPEISDETFEATTEPAAVQETVTTASVGQEVEMVRVEPPPPTAPPPNPMVAQGLQHYWKGEYADALAVLSAAAEADPASVSALYYRGYTHYKMGDFAAAREDFNTAYALDPFFTPVVPVEGAPWLNGGKSQTALPETVPTEAASVEEPAMETPPVEPPVSETPLLDVSPAQEVTGAEPASAAPQGQPEPSAAPAGETAPAMGGEAPPETAPAPLPKEELPMDIEPLDVEPIQLDPLPGA